MNTCIFITNYH